MPQTSVVDVARTRHKQVLDALRQAFNPIVLLARLDEPALSLGGDAMIHVFIGDTHIVPEDDVERWPGRVLTPSRRGALTALLDALDALRTRTPELTVWQLGDLIDLWRIGAEPVESFEKCCDLVNRDWSSLLDRFDPAKSPIRRLFGNHDEGFRQVRQVKDETILPEDPGNTAGSDMLVCHGHQFDPIETLPGLIKASFMRGFTQEVTPLAQDMIAAASPHWMPQERRFTPPNAPKQDERDKFLAPDSDEVGDVPDQAAYNVRRVRLLHRPDANPLEIAANQRLELHDDSHPALWDIAKQRAENAEGAGYAVTLVVVGHTHVPRIVLGQQPDGQPIAMMDCGAWVGPRFLSPGRTHPIHCCQIGVRVGGDLRVYQLGADKYEWPE